jgi:Lhr-like helicase
MREGLIEETQLPRNPLDVLAHQIVAICAEEEIEVADLHTLVRGAYPFADLSRAQLENVLDMLAGRYRRTSSRSSARASSGTGRPASYAGGRERGGSR